MQNYDWKLNILTTFYCYCFMYFKYYKGIKKKLLILKHNSNLKFYAEN